TDRQLKEARLPSSRTSRLFHYGSLAAGLGWGALQETVKRATGLSTTQGPVFINEANADRLVAKLSQMRGAALKLGQMLSIQDNHAFTKELSRILVRVQNSANYMPPRQMTKAMVVELGPAWREQPRLVAFDDVPFAAASIGQVHAAIVDLAQDLGLSAFDHQRLVHRAARLPPQAKVVGQSAAAPNPTEPTDHWLPVAVKVQYPGVADSISNDLDQLKSLLVVSSFLPKGLYLDKTIAAARRELAWETDYQREAECIHQFQALLRDDPDFVVPTVIPALSSHRVLTTERLYGYHLASVAEMDQPTRDWVRTC
ncbi:hypothetical protein H4R34_006088, partial [Dimargaris verticillata]